MWTRARAATDSRDGNRTTDFWCRVPVRAPIPARPVLRALPARAPRRTGLLRRAGDRAGLRRVQAPELPFRGAADGASRSCQPRPDRGRQDQRQPVAPERDQLGAGDHPEPRPARDGGGQDARPGVRRQSRGTGHGQERGCACAGREPERRGLAGHEHHPHRVRRYRPRARPRGAHRADRSLPRAPHRSAPHAGGLRVLRRAGDRARAQGLGARAAHPRSQERDRHRLDRRAAHGTARAHPQAHARDRAPARRAGLDRRRDGGCGVAAGHRGPARGPERAPDRGRGPRLALHGRLSAAQERAHAHRLGRAAARLGADVEPRGHLGAARITALGRDRARAIARGSGPDRARGAREAQWTGDRPDAAHQRACAATRELRPLRRESRAGAHRPGAAKPADLQHLPDPTGNPSDLAARALACLSGGAGSDPGDDGRRGRRLQPGAARRLDPLTVRGRGTLAASGARGPAQASTRAASRGRARPVRGGRGLQLRRRALGAARSVAHLAFDPQPGVPLGLRRKGGADLERSAACSAWPRPERAGAPGHHELRGRQRCLDRCRAPGRGPGPRRRQGAAGQGWRHARRSRVGQRAHERSRRSSAARDRGHGSGREPAHPGPVAGKGRVPERGRAPVAGARGRPGLRVRDPRPARGLQHGHGHAPGGALGRCPARGRGEPHPLAVGRPGQADPGQGPGQRARNRDQPPPVPDPDWLYARL